MEPKDKSENAKSDDWKVPMKMPGADKGEYDASMGAGGGTDAEMLERSKAGKFNSAGEPNFNDTPKKSEEVKNKNQSSNDAAYGE